MSEPRLILGDCVEKMRELPDSSVDSIVTDPPYLIGFMGKAFDSQHRTFVERKSNRRAGSFESAHGNHSRGKASGRRRGMSSGRTRRCAC